MPQPAPGDEVIYHLDTDLLDPAIATVIDHDPAHDPAQMSAPDIDMVLVRWSRTTLRWEYIEDLIVLTRRSVDVSARHR